MVCSASSVNETLAGSRPDPSSDFRHEEALGDLGLLDLRVAGQLQHLHAVAQRLGHRVQDVGRADEHHVRQVVLDVEVVVEERVVLFGVEHLEQGRRRVAAEVHRHLVDFVEEEQRVLRARLLHHLDDLAGERADVGAAVAADLRLVADPAERQPHEVPVHRPGDRLGERRLAHARGAGEGQDRGLGLLDQGAHGEELEDALLHLVEPVVIGVEDGLGPLQVAALLRLLVPGHGHEPVEVVARHGRLGRHRGHGLEALELLDRLLRDLGRHPRPLDLLLEVVDLVALLVLAPQFLLDRLHLLVEVVLLLRLLHLLLHARLDPAVHLELVHLGLEDGGDAVEALEGRHHLEQVLLLLDAHQQVRGDRVRQAAGVVHPHRGDHRVVLQVVRELHVLLEQRHHAAHRALDVAGGVAVAGQHLDDDAEEAPVLLPLDGAPAVGALHEELDVAIGQLQALDDVGDAAHGVDVLGLRVVDLRVVLRREEHPLVLLQRVLEGADRRRPADDKRHHHVREDDQVPQRDDRKGLVEFH